jgi:hypothetical protein
LQLILLASLASATEVVWLAPPDPVAAARVAERAGAVRPALTPTDLRVAATEAGPEDDAAIRRVAGALRDAHPYETRLDGELLIMGGLARPIAAVTLLRDDADRDVLFAALAYQGFAVDRYYGDELGTAAGAEPYRVDFDGVALVRPWVDALALDPDHAIGAYDVAEAPQRAHLLKLQDRIWHSLPALLVPVDFPADAQLVVDGRPVEIGASGGVTVPAGRHLAHVTREGRILARFDLRIAPGEQREVALPLPDADWNAWIASFASADPTAPPAGLRPSIEALGGAVWVVGRRTWVVTAGGTTELDEVDDAPKKTGTSESIALTGGGGWLATWDFYQQDPTDVPASRAAVNAGAVGVGAAFDLDRGIWRFGAGIDTVFTLGAWHVARYGDRSTRARPYPYVSGGLRQLQATAGYLFPFNPGFGARTAIPLGAGPVEIAAAAVYGVPGRRTREDGSSWQGTPVYEAWVGLAMRLGL